MVAAGTEGVYSTYAARVQQRVGDEAVYQNHQRMQKLQADFEAKQKRLELLYEAWEYRMM